MKYQIMLKIGSIALRVTTSHRELIEAMHVQDCTGLVSDPPDLQLDIQLGRVAPRFNQSDLLVWDSVVEDNIFHWWKGSLVGKVNGGSKKVSIVMDERFLDDDLTIPRTIALRTLLIRTYYQALRQQKPWQEVLVHGSSILHNGFCYAFVGKSGSGKTTLCQLADKGRVINDEIIGLARVDREGYRVFWTPLLGSMDGPEYSEYPLRALLILNGHAPGTFIHKLDKITATKALWSLVLYPGDLLSHNRFQVVSERLDMCAELVNVTRCYSMDFSMDKSLWDTIDQIAHGEGISLWKKT